MPGADSPSLQRPSWVPGTATLNVGGFAQVYSVACAPEGNWAAVGTYMDRCGNTRGFVVSRS